MKFKNQAVRLLAMALIGTSALASAQDVTLKIGDPAPPLAVAKWVKGTPVKKLGDGKVHVVEFWATWCGPCKTSIPHLTELAKKYVGKATFTGVSVWENGGDAPWDEQTFAKVAKFVDGYGSKMDYNVAADGPEGIMAKTWMSAAGQKGIPAAFVIGKDGKIAWIGHPMDKLDEVVGQVIAGTFDTSAAAAEMAKQQEEARKQAVMMKPLQDAMKAGNSRLVATEIDKLIASDPKMEMMLGVPKFSALLKHDEKAAYTFGRKLLSDVYKDNPAALNAIAWTIAENKGDALKQPDYALAVAAAERAAELTKDADPLILDTVAYAYFRSGNKKKAVEVQEKAVALGVKAGADFDAATLQEMRERLESFKKG